MGRTRTTGGWRTPTGRSVPPGGWSFSTRRWRRRSGAAIGWWMLARMAGYRQLPSRWSISAAAGLGALGIRWKADGELAAYVRDLTEVPKPFRPDGGGVANPAFLLGLANWILAANVRLGPGIHVQSDVQHHGGVARGSKLVVEFAYHRPLRPGRTRFR